MYDVNLVNLYFVRYFVVALTLFYVRNVKTKGIQTCGQVAVILVAGVFHVTQVHGHLDHDH